MKVWRWLRSRPLARVRRNLATRERARVLHPVLSPEVKELYRREWARRNRVRLYQGSIWEEGRKMLRAEVLNNPEVIEVLARQAIGRTRSEQGDE